MSQPKHDKRPDQRTPQPVDHFQEIFLNKAGPYHRMIAAEDVDGNLLPALQGITGFEGKRVLDLGTGTGRIPLLLEGVAAHTHAIDIHFPMLEENRNQRAHAGGDWGLIHGDMQHLPVTSDSYDAAIAGWAIGHQRFWFQDCWQEIIGRVVSEMVRAVRPGGTLIILETLGTGFTSPAPPAPELAEYYNWLEVTHKFTRIEIQTDYLFSDLDQAVENTAFFFGKELSSQIIENKWKRLPEWTGIWSK